MTDEVDVVPTADVIEHELSDGCACLPRHERVPRADGSDGWIRIHHSWDGRRA